MSDKDNSTLQESVPFEIIRQLTETICESLKSDGWRPDNYGPREIQADLIEKLNYHQKLMGTKERQQIDFEDFLLSIGDGRVKPDAVDPRGTIQRAAVYFKDFGMYVWGFKQDDYVKLINSFDVIESRVVATRTTHLDSLTKDSS